MYLLSDISGDLMLDKDTVRDVSQEITNVACVYDVGISACLFLSWRKQNDVTYHVTTDGGKCPLLGDLITVLRSTLRHAQP